MDKGGEERLAGWVEGVAGQHASLLQAPAQGLAGGSSSHGSKQLRCLGFI